MECKEAHKRKGKEQRREFMCYRLFYERYKCKDNEQDTVHRNNRGGEKKTDSCEVTRAAIRCHITAKLSYIPERRLR